jgi:uncharacterized membrane protein YuzA (DUF378 family)
MMHHHHSPVMRVVGLVSWLLTAIAAIAWGLIALGNSMGKNWNLWESGFISNMPSLIQPLQYAIGIAGLISLYCLLTCHGCKEDRKR